MASAMEETSALCAEFDELLADHVPRSRRKNVQQAIKLTIPA
jgi:hypothetical protein